MYFRFSQDLIQIFLYVSVIIILHLTSAGSLYYNRIE